MISHIYRRKPKNLRLPLAWLAISTFLTSCASAPLPPTLELQAAELAITSAEQSGVADYASPELNLAREKLAAAKSAVVARNMIQAGYLATESRASAEMASARAEMLKARTVNENMRESINTLKQELERNSGDQR